MVRIGGGENFRWIRIGAVLGVLLVASVAIVACGGGASDGEIAAAEKRGRVKKAEKEKERKLEREIHELKREREQEKRRGTAPAPVPSAPPSERSSCGGSLSVGPDTTCAFAENVRAEYEYEIGSGSGTVYAYSEANDEIYEMFCTAAPHECSGAISATVYFP